MAWWNPWKPTPAPAPAPSPPPQSPAPSFGQPPAPFTPPQSPAPPPGTTTGRDAGGNPISIPPPSTGGGSSGGGSSRPPGTVTVIGPGGQPQSVTPEQQLLRATGGSSPAPTQSTSATQVQVKDPLKPQTETRSISGVYTNPLDQKTYSQSFGQSVGASLGLAGSNIKTFFTGRDHNYQNIFDPFRTYYGPSKKDVEVPFYMEQQGTATYDPLTGGIRRTTYGDVAKEQLLPDELERMNIQNVLQTKVYAGEIGVDEAQKQYVADTEGIYRRQGKVYQDMFSRPAQEDIALAGNVAKMGLTAGAFAINPALGVGVLTAEGVWKTTKRADFGDAFRDIQSSIKFGDDRRLSASQSNMFREYTALRTEGGMALLGAGIGSISMPFKVGREITQLRIDEGLKAKTFTTTRELERGGISITRSGTPNFESFQKIQFGTQAGKDGQIFVTGTGKGTIRYLDFTKQMQNQYAWVSSTKGFSFGGQVVKGNFLGITKGGITSTQEGLSSTILRKGYLVRGDTFSKITPRGTISKPVGDLTLTRTGELGAVKVTDTGFVGRFNLKDFGVVKPSFTGVKADGSFGGFGGTGTGGLGGGGSGGVSGGGFTITRITPPTGLGGRLPPVNTNINLGGSTAGVGGKVPSFQGLQQGMFVQPTTTQNIGGLFAGATQTQTLTLARSTTPIFAIPSISTRQTQMFAQPQQTFQRPEAGLELGSLGLLSSMVADTSKRSRGGSGFMSGSFISPLSTQERLITPVQIITQRPELRPPQRLVPAGLTGLGGGSLIGGAGFFGKGFAIPKLPFGADSSGGLGKIKASRTYRYTPSFGALALKGQAFKVGALSTKKFTGLEFRGSTPKTTKKKSRKSKK